MYYAYSISLVYYLRAHGDKNLAGHLLDLLKVDEINKTNLTTLIQRNQDLTLPIPNEDLKTVQMILGPACRKFAADSAKKEFIEQSEKSALYAASAYKFRSYLDTYLRTKSLVFRNNITRPKEDNGTFSAAEIFKVHGMLKRMEDYVDSIRDSIVTVMNSHEDPFNTTIAHFDQQIEVYVKEFFTRSECSELTTYYDYINADKQWGTEDILTLLHRSMCEEYAEQDVESGIVTVKHKTEINLEIYQIGRSLNNINEEKLDLVINHNGINHWTSIIPEKYLNCPNSHSRGFFAPSNNMPQILLAGALMISACMALAFTGYLVIGLVLAALIICSIVAMLPNESCIKNKP